MAKVSKRVKQVEEKKAPTLTHDEHLKVETSPILVENAKLLMAVEEQSLANLVLELKLLESKIEKQKYRVSECHTRYNLEKNRHKNVITGIMKNHNLDSEKFSYNNNTGEIIL